MRPELREELHGPWWGPCGEGPKVSKQSRAMVNPSHTVQPAKPSLAPPPRRRSGDFTTGNQVMQRLLIQAKLTVSQPGDPFEHEADRVAEAVMRIPTPLTTGEARVAGQAQGVR